MANLTIANAPNGALAGTSLTTSHKLPTSGDYYITADELCNGLYQLEDIYRVNTEAELASAIASAKNTILIDNDITLTSNKTIAQAVIYRNGVTIDLGNYDLTHNGPIINANSITWQIFDCSGSGRVYFGAGAVPYADPRWWCAPSSDDNAALNNCMIAIDNAGGGEVRVYPAASEYIFTQIDVPSNVTFRGMGGWLKLKDNTCTVAGGAYYPIRTREIDGSTWETSNTHFVDLLIDGNQSGGNTGFIGTGGVADAIHMQGSRNSIERCTIINPPDSGIMWAYASNSKVADNYIDGASDVGIYISDTTGVVSGDESFENICRGNVVKNCLSEGIRLTRLSRRIVVTENQIYNCSFGFSCQGVDEVNGPTLFNLSNNYIRYCGTGIFLRRVNYAVVTGNIIEDNDKHGIYLQAVNNSTVSHNVVVYRSSPDATFSYGMVVMPRRISSTNYDSKNNTIIGNVVLGGSQAAFITIGHNVSGTYYGQVDNNVVTGNNFSGGTYGMHIVNNSSNNILQNNVLAGTTADLNYDQTNKNIIKDNKLVNGTSTSGAWSINGIRTHTISPSGVYTPIFIGEILHDTGNNNFYVGYSTTNNTHWKSMT